ncbi:MAG: hypothetical protein JWQ22_735 [Devosia sp.]|nr:hypothetical protein [Devosia sp.]
MRAYEMITILSEAFGFPFDAAYRIDRVLAEAGMRAKGKGRNLPEMDRREALTFLIACMAVDKITKADEEVSPWLSARGTVNKDPKSIVPDEWEEPDMPARTKHYLAMERVLVPHKDHNGEVQLIDYLLAVCELLQNEDLRPGQIKFEIELSQMGASCSYKITENDILDDLFFVIDPETQRPIECKNLDTAIRRKCSLSGFGLLEIIKRT